MLYGLRVYSFKHTRSNLRSVNIAKNLSAPSQNFISTGTLLSLNEKLLPRFLQHTRYFKYFPCNLKNLWLPVNKRAFSRISRYCRSVRSYGVDIDGYTTMARKRTAGSVRRRWGMVKSLSVNNWLDTINFLTLAGYTILIAQNFFFQWPVSSLWPVKSTSAFYSSFSDCNPFDNHEIHLKYSSRRFMSLL